MKGKIVLITVEEKARSAYLQDLKYFFDEYVRIDGFCISNGFEPEYLKDADLIIVTNELVYTYVKNMLSRDTKVIYLVYTFPTESFSALKAIPDNSRVIFVESNEYLAMDSIGILKSLGIKNLDIIPYFPGVRAGGSLPEVIDTAITPDVACYIPDSARSIINIGSKKVDSSVIKYIAGYLSIDGEEYKKKLSSYEASTVSTDEYRSEAEGLLNRFDESSKPPSSLRKCSKSTGYVAKWTFDDIVHKSRIMSDCIKKAIKIAGIDQTTLIIGETGTGKEMFANSIHNASKRKNYPFVAVNCASLSESVLESELFGYEYGAFTGASRAGRKGLFELAQNGTIFLDEIGETSVNFQSKLLRVLQEGEIMKIGGSSIIPIDVRVIAATNKDLHQLIEQKRFREDLYYRLNVFTLILPTLRERREDIPLLIESTMQGYSGNPKHISQELMSLILNYDWWGNVRELKNCMEYMLYMGGSELTTDDLPPFIHLRRDEADSSYFEDRLTELYDNEKKLVKSIVNICMYRSVGRRGLHTLLNEQGYPISEYKLRKILELMRKKGIIDYGSGRQGIRLIRQLLD